jgi:hypothetical protein
VSTAAPRSGLRRCLRVFRRPPRRAPGQIKELPTALLKRYPKTSQENLTRPPDSHSKSSHCHFKFAHAVFKRIAEFSHKVTHEAPHTASEKVPGAASPRPTRQPQERPQWRNETFHTRGREIGAPSPTLPPGDKRADVSEAPAKFNASPRLAQ